MIETIEILPGITLRCCPDHRFRTACLSIQLIRPMQKQEAGLNALIPSVLLRGCRTAPDLREITLQLDDLYGASVSALVRRIGDYQTTGLYAAFLEDSYALPGEQVLNPMAEFLGQLLLHPVLTDGGLDPEYTESEKKNLIAAIEADLNDKRIYAATRMIRTMCREDSMGVPRLGTPEQIASIDPAQAWAHWQRILRQSPIELFYVGSAPAARVAEAMTRLFRQIDRDYRPLPPQTPFRDGGPGGEITEQMEVSQGKLCLGCTSPITNQDPRFAAMQMFNTIFGAGMTSKLFQNIREKMSLCYSIGSSYYGSKGILTISAGIDSDKDQLVRQEIRRHLDACIRGEISDQEMTAAREAIYSGLRAVTDAPGTIEGYFSTAALSGMAMDPEAYMKAVSAVTREQVAAAAATVRLHTCYFLKGVSA